MAVYLMKMKRKDFEYVNEDFFLTSPAIKIRRLDAELPPIIEEDDPNFPRSVGVDNLSTNISRTGSSSQVREGMPASSDNVDRDNNLFNPTPLPLSPSQFSIDSDILSGIKKNIHSTNQSSLVKSAEEEGTMNTRRNECLAVIPWNPSLQQLPSAATSGNMKAELEEDEQMGEATIMDIEEDYTCTEYYSQQMNENMQQWQQQQQQQQQSNHMNENLFQWQQQQHHQQQQQHHHQQQQQSMMIPQPPPAPLMQYKWW